jgi:hypothetical protein
MKTAGGGGGIHSKQHQVIHSQRPGIKVHRSNSLQVRGKETPSLSQRVNSGRLVIGSKKATIGAMNGGNALGGMFTPGKAISVLDQSQTIMSIE